MEFSELQGTPLGGGRSSAFDRWAACSSHGRSDPPGVRETGLREFHCILSSWSSCSPSPSFPNPQDPSLTPSPCKEAQALSTVGGLVPVLTQVTPQWGLLCRGDGSRGLCAHRGQRAAGGSEAERKCGDIIGSNLQAHGQGTASTSPGLVGPTRPLRGARQPFLLT